jgi:hypothetical protein
VRVTDSGKFILVEVTETPDLRQLLSIIDNAPAVVGKGLLVDFSAQALADPSAHALLGDHMAAAFAKATRIAIVVRDDVVSYNSERVARRRRINLRVFTDRSEAEGWIVAS